MEEMVFEWALEEDRNERHSSKQQRHGEDAYTNLQFAKVRGQLSKSDSGSEHLFFRLSA